MDLKDSEKHRTGIAEQRSGRDQDSVSQPGESGQLKVKQARRGQWETLVRKVTCFGEKWAGWGN